jgi:serine/threonine protein kinase
VLFTWDGTLKLSDFGLSRQLSTNPSQNVRKLSPGLPSGLDGGDTASNGAADDDDDASFSWEAHSGPTGGGGWFAPEVYRKQRKTRAVDLFGLG